MKQRHLQMAVSFLLASGLSACSGTGGSLPATNQNVTNQSTAMQGNAVDAAAQSASAGSTLATSRTVAGSSMDVRRTTAISDAASSAAGVAIDVGGKATGSWLADTAFSGGSSSVSTSNVNTSRVTNPAPQGVYQTNRNGTRLTAVITNLTPLAAYTVRLHFAELFWNAAGKRAFNASINGVSVLTTFDIFAAAGGKYIAVVKQFSTSADASGKITLVLAATTNNALISGVEIIPAVSASPAPVPTPTSAPTPMSSPTPPPTGWAGNVFPAWDGNHLLPTNPVIHPQSQAMMDVQYNNQRGHTLTGPAVDDAQSSYYDAKSSDPVHTVHCTANWGPKPTGHCAMEGKQIHVPAGAVAGGNSDRHTSILQPDGCTLEDFWHMQASMDTPTIVATFGAEYDQCTGNGFLSVKTAGATQGGGSNRLGRASLAELETGVIHHAVEIADSCMPIASSVGQSMTAGNNVACAAGDSGPTMPYGAYLWSDVKPANLPASLDKATRMICTALNQYGGVVDDTIGPWNGLSINTLWNQSGDPAYTAWFKANSTNNATNPTSCFPGGDWSHHIHVLQW
jgi:hypothetical protein